MKTKTIKLFCHISTGYVGSANSETIEVEIPLEATAKEIESQCKEAYWEWFANNAEASWHIED